MQGTNWTPRNWLRKLAWYLRDEAGHVSFHHALYPEQQFREELEKEKHRAERSGRAMLLMLIDTGEIMNLAPKEGIAETVGDGISSCVRATDICGQLQEGVLVGVILTEIEPDKIEAAQLRVARKTRGKLAALFGEVMANRVKISFDVVTPASRGGIRQVAGGESMGEAATGLGRLTNAGEAQGIPVEIYRAQNRR